MRNTLIAIGIAVVVAVIWLKDHDALVKSRVLYAQRDSARADSIETLKGEAVALVARRDTLLVTRTKELTRFDTLTQTLFSRDTLRVHDTLYVKASTADAAVNACRAIITTDDRLSSTCEERIKNALDQAKLNDSRRADTEDQQPGFLRRHAAVTVGYGAMLDGKAVRFSPAVTVGWKFWP